MITIITKGNGNNSILNPFGNKQIIIITTKPKISPPVISETNVLMNQLKQKIHPHVHINNNNNNNNTNNSIFGLPYSYGGNFVGINGSQSSPLSIKNSNGCYNNNNSNSVNSNNSNLIIPKFSLSIPASTCCDNTNKIKFENEMPPLDSDTSSIKALSMPSLDSEDTVEPVLKNCRTEATITESEEIETMLNQKIILSRKILTDKYELEYNNYVKNKLLNEKFYFPDDIKPYHCPHKNCEKKYKTKASLYVHYRIHSLYSFECQKCNKKFSRARLLIEHSRVHTHIKPFKCHMCTKSFTQRHSLVEHFRTHSGEKPFQCKECNKKFAVKHNLRIHLKTHSSDKPAYRCKVCGKNLTSLHGFRGHMKKFHGEKV